jgi:putative extracellular protein
MLRTCRLVGRSSHTNPKRQRGTPRRLFLEPLERRELLTYPAVSISMGDTTLEGETGSMVVTLNSDPDNAD